MNRGRAAPFRVVIAGGGVAAVEALLALRQLAENRVSIELLSAEPQFWYRPLSTAEGFDGAQVHGLDLSAVADECGAALVLGTLESVDVDASRVTTAGGAELEYDALLIAVGARPVDGVPGALTFRGPADSEAMLRLVAELEAGEIKRVAFALPGTVAWPLPLYELALQASFVASRRNAEVALVTPEERPLALFGAAASNRIADVLAERGIELVTGSYPIRFEHGLLALAPEGAVPADRVVAMPRLVGPAIRGLVCDLSGFIPTKPDGRVGGTSNVFAAGDATSFPIKQGGLAAQQADAAAESIAALAGAPVEPQSFRPILRGLVLTGGTPLYARRSLAEPGPTPEASADPLWWPPGKIAGRYLAPYLAARADAILTPPKRANGVPVEVELSS